MILERRVLRCEKRLGRSGGMLPRESLELLDLGNAISRILVVVLSIFKRITEVRLIFRLSVHREYHYIEYNIWMCGNMKFISSVDQNISRVSEANE